MLSRSVSWPGDSVAAFVLLLSLVAASGCADSTGPGAASNERQGESSRDIGDRMDEAMNNFKSE